MYRKQVRRRRAVLTLLILGCFLLLTISYGHGSGSIQDGVSTIFSPLEGVANRALKPARDLVDWFDKTFEARGENSRLSEELEQARIAGGRRPGGDPGERAAAQARRNSTSDPVIATSEFEPVTGRVIARSPTVWHSSVAIDVGSGEGVGRRRPGDQRRRPGRRDLRGAAELLPGPADHRPRERGLGQGPAAAGSRE